MRRSLSGRDDASASADGAGVVGAGVHRARGKARRVGEEESRGARRPRGTRRDARREGDGKWAKARVACRPGRQDVQRGVMAAGDFGDRVAARTPADGDHGLDGRRDAQVDRRRLRERHRVERVGTVGDDAALTAHDRVVARPREHPRDGTGRHGERGDVRGTDRLDGHLARVRTVARVGVGVVARVGVRVRGLGAGLGPGLGDVGVDVGVAPRAPAADHGDVVLRVAGRRAAVRRCVRLASFRAGPPLPEQPTASASPSAASERRRIRAFRDMRPDQ
jgi:hypothetical protein